MCGNSFWVNATVAKKLVSKVSRRISGDTALAGLGTEPDDEVSLSFQTPALLTKMSRWPYFFAK